MRYSAHPILNERVVHLLRFYLRSVTPLTPVPTKGQSGRLVGCLWKPTRPSCSQAGEFLDIDCISPEPGTS